jgi:hypothetical protein
MYDYQTPIRKKSPHILGMTVPQLGLLAGLVVVQLVIIGLALKFFVFTPQEAVLPTVTPVTFASLAPSASIPTPVLDFTTAVLTIDDLPAGFFPPPDNVPAIDFKEEYPKIKFQPANKFTLYEREHDQFVNGWTFVFTTTQARENFDILVAHPNDMFYNLDNPDEGVKSLEGSELGKPNPIGELSTGWTVYIVGNSYVDRADVVLFSHKNFGGVVEVLYSHDQTPVVSAWEVAQKLDSRITDVLVNGPIPTPVVIPFERLAGVKLTLDDLPAGFQVTSQEDLGQDTSWMLSVKPKSMHVAEVFDYQSEKENAEEYIMGYTFQFTSTFGMAMMDQILMDQELLDYWFPDSPTQRRQPLEITRPIGDRAVSTAIMYITEKGGLRCDALAFRRGHVGAVLLYIYIPGRRQTTVEDLAVKLDARLKNLASP